jgi:hypothetical protein
MHGLDCLYLAFQDNLNFNKRGSYCIKKVSVLFFSTLDGSFYLD